LICYLISLTLETHQTTFSQFLFINVVNNKQDNFTRLHMFSRTPQIIISLRILQGHCTSASNQGDHQQPVDFH